MSLFVCLKTQHTAVNEVNDSETAGKTPNGRQTKRGWGIEMGSWVSVCQHGHTFVGVLGVVDEHNGRVIVMVAQRNHERRCAD